MNIRMLSIALYCIVVMAHSGCDTKTEVRTFSSITNTTYEYQGTLGIVGVASSATAYYANIVVARAEVKFDGKLESGSLKTLDVEETHYDRDGCEVYRGMITFEMKLGNYMVIEESTTRGKRPFPVFRDWPSTN